MPPWLSSYVQLMAPSRCPSPAVPIFPPFSWSSRTCIPSTSFALLYFALLALPCPVNTNRNSTPLHSINPTFFIFPLSRILSYPALAYTNPNLLPFFCFLSFYYQLLSPSLITWNVFFRITSCVQLIYHLQRQRASIFTTTAFFA